VRISSLRSLFHVQLAALYEEREIDAIFFIYIDYKYNIKKHRFFLDPEQEIEFDKVDIEALEKGCPIQYITGKTTFCDFEIGVNSSVLIPRPETEELVELVLEKVKQSNRIIDFCTGTGAIAIALAKNLKNLAVWATDNSADALKTAGENAFCNRVEINFLHHNILTDGCNMLPDNVDIIVSNPPYIPLSERAQLHKNVVHHEPYEALFVPDENPLLYYHAIAQVAKKILRVGGLLFVETYHKFHYDLTAMFAEFGFFEIECRNDINGKPRFICAKKL
jgi:release factor glutamine methyltransferase